MKTRQITDYLKAWDSSVPEEYYRQLTQLDSRRTFLKQLVGGAAAIVFSENLLANTNKLDNGLWKTFSSVHLHMFPQSPNSPGAHSINATAYLKSVLEWPGVDEADKKFIQDGVGWLNGVAKKQFNKVFYLLDEKQKETVLRTVEKSQVGENWLSLVLLYLMEALLTDPVYGGNVNGTGWAWLQHQPGFPRPAANKRYFHL